MTESRHGDGSLLAGTGDVWVLGDVGGTGLVAPVVLELLAEARRLAASRAGSRVGVVLIGQALDAAIAMVADHGAEQILVAEHPELAVFRDEPYAALLAEAIRRHQPAIVLGGATTLGRAVLPRVAVLLHTGLTADCTALALDPETGILLQTRPAFGGNLLATIACPRHRPQMATVRPGVFRPQPCPVSRPPEILPLPFSGTSLASRIHTVRPLETPQGGHPLRQAATIVAAGAGVGGPDGVALVDRLARTIGGTLAASRAVVDADWADPACQVGQTGQTVQPHLYIACGVSGAIQHIVGMQSSDIIVAINRDPEAPILNVADYALVGDLFEIIPALIDAWPAGT